MQGYREEIAAASAHEISADGIGEWYDIVETSLFMLLRRTEVFRGTMRLIITDRQTARCMLYPDGTFLISSGLLDYIDSTLFLDTSVSARRIRNFNTEREHFFAPVAAVYAAQFALNYYTASPQQPLSKEKVYMRDIMASVLLDIAGYPRGLLEAWLTRLDIIGTKSDTARVFHDFLSESVSPKERLEQLYNNEDTGAHLYEEISGVLFALQNKKGTIDARNAIENLRQLFPDSLYLNRLHALICHQAWLNTLDKQKQELATLLPAAVYDNQTVLAFFQTLALLQDQDDEDAEYHTRMAPSRENSKTYEQAKKAYKDYLSNMYEAGMVSSYAHLLAVSPLVHERTAALGIAEKADLYHASLDDKTARANYAALLYLIGKDYTKARFLLADCMQQPEKIRKKNQQLFLQAGFPSDERLIRCNYIRILTVLGESNNAQEEKKRLGSLLKEPSDDTPLTVRNIALGTAVDDLLTAWNKPSSIIYNYYSERWVYRLFNTEVLIRAKDRGGTVLQITLGYPSSLTIFQDVRTGDSRQDFEKVFGLPLYRSCDSLMYHRSGTLLQVLYGNNKIRSVTLRKIYEKR